MLAHAKAQTLELLRFPTASVPTLAFPAMFFLFFGVPNAGGRANLLMASYAGFAVLGIAFFQFGVGIAAERASPWERFLRTLPVSPQARFGARILSALVFALASAGVVVACALLATSAGLGLSEWLRFAGALLAGSVPFALLGIAIGYWTRPKAALPLANLLYLSLSYAGGLWTTPSHLPRLVADLSPYLPTRQWGNVLWEAVGGAPWRAQHWLSLAGYALAFALLAVWGYRRDEGERYR